MKLVTFVRSEAGSKPRIEAWLDGDIVDIEAALRLIDRSRTRLMRTQRATLGQAPGNS